MMVMVFFFDYNFYRPYPLHKAHVTLFFVCSRFTVSFLPWFPYIMPDPTTLHNTNPLFVLLVDRSHSLHVTPALPCCPSIVFYICYHLHHLVKCSNSLWMTSCDFRV